MTVKGEGALPTFPEHLPGGWLCDDGDIRPWRNDLGQEIELFNSGLVLGVPALLLTSVRQGGRRSGAAQGGGLLAFIARVSGRVVRYWMTESAREPMPQASKPKRKTHAANFVEHLKKAPNQTLRRCDLIDLYRAHSAGHYGPMNNTVERVIGSVAERVGYGLYRLREEYRDDAGDSAAPSGAVGPASVPGLTFDTGPLVSAWDVPCPECGAPVRRDCINDTRQGCIHLRRQELANKVRRRVSRLPNKGRRVPSEAT